MVSYCDSSNDRSLTNNLIENSFATSHDFHHFSNKSQWIDGLDSWSSAGQNQKIFLHQNSLDFHSDIGLYLPRLSKDHPLDKFNEHHATISNNKLIVSISERNERRSLSDRHTSNGSDLNQYQSDEQKSTNDEHDRDNLHDNENRSSRSSQHLKWNEANASKVRTSLRHVPSQNIYPSVHQTKQLQQKPYQTINKDNLKLLLKEQLSSLFGRDTGNIHSRRAFIKIPTIDIKHQNYLRRPTPLIDSTLLMDRCDRLQQLSVYQPAGSIATKNHLLDVRRAPIRFQGVSNLGLSITPIDFSICKNLENYSFEAKSDRLNQQISVRGPTNKKEDKDGIFSYSASDNSFQRLSTNLCITTRNSIDEQKQLIRRFSRQYYSSSKNSLQRSSTYQILPSLVTGKRIHTPITNHRLS